MWSNMFPTRNVDRRFRCFGCLHVQTATIWFGIYNLLIQLLTVVLFLYGWTCKDGGEGGVEYSTVVATTIDRNETRTTTTMFGNRTIKSLVMMEEEENQQPPPTASSSSSIPTKFQTRGSLIGKNGELAFIDEFHLHLIFMVAMLVITTMLIYGALTAKRFFVLPFFCFQVFDFILYALASVGTYNFVPSNADGLNDSKMLSSFVKSNPHLASFIFLFCHLAGLVVKAYFVGVVWTFYQFCRLRATMPNERRDDTTAEAIQLNDEHLLPPSYDNALKMARPADPASTTPPPPYQQAAEQV